MSGGVGGSGSWDHSWDLSLISSLQFQGKWYIIALAGNAVQKKLGSINMFTTTYHLTEGHSYNVTNTLIR